MSSLGVDPQDVLVRARGALLDALEALRDQRDAVIVIGAQAVYLRTGAMTVALAETTKDADVTLDPGALRDDPRIEAAMNDAHFYPAVSGQPGSWVTSEGIEVDLMVPEKVAGDGGPTTRGARLPPHDKKAMRRARGLEAALVDNGEMDVQALDPDDTRVVRVRVAGPAALLVSKLHKIKERVGTHRLNDKDAHDAYRILVKYTTEELRTTFGALLENELSGEVTRQALDYLDELFAQGPEATGAGMAGRAEEGVGNPEEVAVAVSILASDLVASLRAS